MKRKLIHLTIILLFFLFPVISSFADQPLDAPPPPNPGGTGGGTPVGAPIDNGTTILLMIGIGYGGWKLYKVRDTGSPEAQIPE